MFSFTLSNAQVTVESLESLTDGTILIQVGGIKYRGLPAPKLREIIQQQEELKLCNENRTSLQNQFGEFRVASEQLRQETVDKMNKEREKVQRELEFYISEYGKEAKLRETFQKELERCKKFIIWRIC